MVYDNVIMDEEENVIDVDENYMCRVCSRCLEENYHHNEYIDEYVRNGCDD